MGWSYTYFLLDKPDMETLRLGALKLGLNDYTDLYRKMQEFDRERMKAILRAQKAYDKNDSREVHDRKLKAFTAEFEKRPDDPQVKWFRDLQYQQDITMFQMWFKNIDGHHIVMFTHLGAFLINQFEGIILHLLMKSGYRGAIFHVHANSVTDGADIWEGMIGDSFPNDFKVKVIETTEGNYQKDLDREVFGINLMKIHDSLTGDEVTNELTLGIKLEDLKKIIP